MPGFVSSPAPKFLRIGRAPPAGDPFAGALREGAPIGLLGIELQTRRRNRVNGIVSECDPSGFTVAIHQAYGNCSRYIQQRDCVDARELSKKVRAQTFSNLDDVEARTLLGGTDTMFVASYAPGPDSAPAMDVSHRGGKPGFLRLDNDSGITIPDFASNRYFRNILSTGRAGLIVPNFETGDILLFTGNAAVGIDGESYADAVHAGLSASGGCTRDRAGGCVARCRLHFNSEPGRCIHLRQASGTSLSEGYPMPQTRPPLPPFTAETAAEKARAAEDAWNGRDPARIALAYSLDSDWRNRAEFIYGREGIVAFLERKWARELDYRLIKEVGHFTKTASQSGSPMSGTTIPVSGFAHTVTRTGSSMSTV